MVLPYLFAEGEGATGPTETSAGKKCRGNSMHLRQKRSSSGFGSKARPWKNSIDIVILEVRMYWAFKSASAHTAAIAKVEHFHLKAIKVLVEIIFRNAEKNINQNALLLLSILRKYWVYA